MLDRGKISGNLATRRDFRDFSPRLRQRFQTDLQKNRFSPARETLGFSSRSPFDDRGAPQRCAPRFQ